MLFNLLHHLSLPGSLDADIESQLSELFRSLLVLLPRCLFLVSEAFLVGEGARPREKCCHLFARLQRGGTHLRN